MPRGNASDLRNSRGWEKKWRRTGRIGMGKLLVGDYLFVYTFMPVSISNQQPAINNAQQTQQLALQKLGLDCHRPLSARSAQAGARRRPPYLQLGFPAGLAGAFGGRQ